MRQILTIAFREITRLRKRFSGGASPLAVLFLLAVLGMAALAFHQAAVLGSGLYRVGVYGDVPAITDSRFAVQRVEPVQAQALLDARAIDVFIQDAQVIHRQDERSLFAVGALRRYLEKQELARVGNAYPAEQAFPLRVGIAYLAPPAAVPDQPAAGPDGAQPPAGQAALPATDSAVEDEVIIPSLMTPKAPFAEVLVAMLYILPVTFISVFFTSSFMDEKLNRRLTILLSTPVTTFQIIAGKMLPYAVFAMLSTIAIALATRANPFMALAIFTPAIFFIFAIYLMVPLFYRTFKDTTFISMLVTTLTTVYLVFPAMFNGVSDMAYMSPLTLAVKMYRAEPFGWREYLFPSLPMLAIFGLAVFAGTRLLNEEFITGYRPLLQKAKDAIYLIIDREHPNLSIGLLSLLLIPIVYLVQLVALAFATNLPPNVMLVATLVAAALVEEVVKSIGIVVLFQRRVIQSSRQVLWMAFLSSLGFLAGEKLLLFFSVGSVAQSALSGAIFSTGLLLVPLLAHFFFTAAICLAYTRLRMNYSLALLIAAVLHSLYNYLLLGGL